MGAEAAPELPLAPGLEEILGALRTDGVAVCDGFLSPLEVSALAGCADARRERGDFAEGRIGADSRLQRRAEVRGDSICWLEHAQFVAEIELLQLLERLRLGLNRGALLGLFELELHYAHYPAGARYSRHVDRPLGHRDRQVSLALYLNENWSASDGGALRICCDGDRSRDIDPTGGRLVLFLTEDRAHEVLPTRRDRLSLTGWFRGRAQAAG